jgi:predicted nucleic acid-binding protein
MPSPDRLVINTGPLIALVAGLGHLDILHELYREVIVPLEVAEEIATLRASQFVQPEFARATWLTRRTTPVKLAPWLGSVLDRGEAAMIQLALDEKLSTVCIDEAAGRRVAQSSGLLVTGSLGILLRAKRESRLPSLRTVLDKMRSNGVWLGDKLVAAALVQAAGE